MRRRQVSSETNCLLTGKILCGVCNKRTTVGLSLVHSDAQGSHLNLNKSEANHFDINKSVKVLPGGGKLAKFRVFRLTLRKTEEERPDVHSRTSLMTEEAEEEEQEEYVKSHLASTSDSSCTGWWAATRRLTGRMNEGTSTKG